MAGMKDEQGRILEDTSSLFDELSEAFPHEKYTSFASKLGVKYEKATGILVKYGNDYQKSLREVLSSWESECEDATKTKLNDALKAAKAGGLCRIVDKHFTEGCKDLSPAGRAADDATAGNRDSDSGRQIHQSNATINVNLSGGATSGNITITGMSATINE